MLTVRRRKTAIAILAGMLAFAIVTPAPIVGAAPADKPPRQDTPRTPDRSLSDVPYAQGELIVRFEEGVGELTKHTAHAALGSRVQRSFRIVPGLQAVKLSHGRSVEAAIRSYQEMPGVLYAQPNYIKQALSVPNDSRFSELWGLHNTGQTAGLADADIDAPEAWNLTTGSSDVIVAVIDTGIDYEHPDLAANMWTNPGEIPNNGIDDDGNGYIDDVHGWDAVGNDGNPMDDHGHGTHTAGTIGAVGNDGFGITGVNQDASIMAIKVLDEGGYGTTTDIIEGFQYLAQSPARLSSNSWGGWYVADIAERDAIAAVDKLFVFAAGNEGRNIDVPYGATQEYSYPASYNLPNILSVGATDASDKRAPFSNWGAANVDVFAPGMDILSTQPAPRRLIPAIDATVNPLFADNFTTLDAWSTTDHVKSPWARVTGAYTSAPSSAAHLGYQSDEAAYLDQITAVDLSPADYPGMRFKWNYNLEPDWDFAEVWVFDESDAQWYYIGGRSGHSGGFVEQYVDLGRFAGQNDIHVAFGLWADSSIDSDEGYQGVWVDDVEIFDLDSAKPGTSPWVIEIMGGWENAYASWSGTSMATPHVAGIAALALSRNEWLDVGDLKRLVMDTVDVKPQLDGLCATEGRVNAASAVVAAVPVAHNDEFTAEEDGVLTVLVGTGVLANDSYFDHAALAAVLATDTAHGGLALGADGALSYTPDADFNGTDEFTYRASDGSLLSDVATVTITVTPLNDAPMALADDYAIEEDGVLGVPAITGVLANDSDKDLDSLTAVLATDTAHGELALGADGSLSYTPDADFNGTDEFAYRASDLATLSAPATVTITVTPLNDAPLALSDAYAIGEDGVLAVILGTGVLVNDSDIEGDALTAVLATDTAHGELLLGADGAFNYAPDPYFNGTDEFTYRASDAAESSNVATVTITVTPVNDAPLALSDAYVIGEDGVLAVTAGTGLLANDSDVDLDALTAVLATDTAHGELLLGADGSFTYTPDADFNGTDEFTYRASDGTAESASATVTITVTPVDEPLPPVIALAGATRFDTAVAISQEAYPSGLPIDGERTVLIATGRNWPDALGGSALAGVLDGPILLVDTASVPASVTAEITRLGAIRAIILGGTNAVNETVETALAGALDGEAVVERIAGASRYETADRIATYVIAAQDTWDGTAFVATGAKFPDALGAAPLAAANGWPLYLSHPVTGLSAVTRAAMMPAQRVLVLGGTSAVSAREYANLLSAFGGAVERLDDSDRYETAVTVASFGVQHAGLGWNRVAIATGVNFPDAMAGGVLQGKAGSVMLLTRPTPLDDYTAAAIIAHRADITTVTYFGGTGALPESLRGQVADILWAD